MAAAARIGLPPAEDDPLERGESEEEEVESDEEGGDDGLEDENLADCELDAGSDEDPSFDPSFDPASDSGPEGEAALWSGMARLSISARKSRKGSVAPKMGKEDSDLLAMVDKLMRDGQLEKLKVDECKAYLRMHKLRLSGRKQELLNRIREHIEVKTLGDVKYPVSSFVLNCKGDACKGDVVMFEQNIYRRKKGDPRGVKGHQCGQRTNAGRIIKESYGTAKQHHTFTVEIFWSKGYKPWPPLHPLLIKGRNLYKDKTMRQPWPDEQERSRVLQEKHARGFIARKSRDVRIHEKEINKMRRFNRIKDNTRKRQENVNQISSQEVPQQKVMSTNIVDQRFDERMTPSLQHAQPWNARQQQQISSKQNPANHLLYQQQPYHQHCNEVLQQESATRTSRPEFIDHQVLPVQHVKPEKTSQQQILSRPTPAQKIFKHPTQDNDQRPTPSQQTFKHVEKHNNQHQHNKVLPQGGTAGTFSILGQPWNAMPQEKISIRNPPQPLKHQHHNAVLLQQGAKKEACSILGQPGNAMPQEKISIRNQPHPLKHQHHNAVLLQQGAKKETCRVDSIAGPNYRSGTESGKPPCIQHVGAVNARQQHISSKPALPQQIKNSYHSTEYGESAFHHGNTLQHGSNGHPIAHVDHQWHHPLKPINKDFCSRNQVEDYYDHGQLNREEYHSQEIRHQKPYGRRQTTQDQYHQPQKTHHQNHHDNWRMNHSQYHSQENHPQDYWYAQQFPPLKPCAQQFPSLKPCRYYQQGLWCPYEENCKFSHGT
uniref:Uncharacterized protein n=1 Tax=Avena sativa TaxID=4498 RepID=A0ACD5ZG02_AVESA